jgi:hypothetical protein
MRPVRIKLGVFGPNNTMSNTLPLYVMSGSGWNGGQNVGNAAVGPFESGHTNGGRAITITGSCPIISRIDPTLSQNHNIRIAHYRLWIDGVDVTGVVATNQKFTTPLRQLQRNLGFVATLNMTCPETVATEAEVEADVWVELDVQRGTFNSSAHTSGGYVPGLLRPAGGGAANLETSLQIFPFGYWSRGQRINTGGVVDQRWFFDADFEQGINVNARRGRNDVYTLAFDRAGPAGLSSLVMQPQANWDYTNPFPGVIRLQKTTGTGALDFVLMNWQREVPLITISKRGVTPEYTSEPGEIVRYAPEPNATFTRWDSSVTDGTWPVGTSTVFRAVGRGVSQELGDIWQSQSYFSRALNVSDAFASFPLTITVTR